MASYKQLGRIGLRGQLGSHVAGPGITQAFYELDDTYKDKKIKPHNVRFSNDYEGRSDEEFDALCKALSGTVKTIKIGGNTNDRI